MLLSEPTILRERWCSLLKDIKNPLWMAREQGRHVNLFASVNFESNLEHKRSPFAVQEKKQGKCANISVAREDPAPRCENALY